MATIDQVGDLWEKIAKFDNRSKELRVESNTIVGYIPGPDGRPEQIVTDEARFAEIGQEMKACASGKAATISKLAAVQALLGHNEDGCLANLDGSGYIDQATRLRFRFANELHPMMVNYRRALTLAEVQELPEFKRLESATLPEIQRLEEKAAADQALAAQVRAILQS
jgi:hypothetical protein